jgi:hypothetical protein
MTRRLIRYQARPEQAAENQRLIENVFAELRDRRPEGVRYMVLRLADDSFVHIVETEREENPLLALPAFKAFSTTARERQLEAPVVNEAMLVGDYCMLETR